MNGYLTEKPDPYALAAVGPHRNQRKNSMRLPSASTVANSRGPDVRFRDAVTRYGVEHIGGGELRVGAIDIFRFDPAACGCSEERLRARIDWPLAQVLAR